jgi:membrane protease YdiL (CAAX protease family)
MGILLTLCYYCHRIYPFTWQRGKIKLSSIVIYGSLAGIYWLIIVLLKYKHLPLWGLSSNDSWIVTCLFLIKTALLAPILEELLFRKWMFSYMKAQNFSPFLILLFTSVLFYLWHGEPERWELLGWGVLFGWIYMKGKHLAYPIAAHMIVNILASLFHV